MLLKTILKLVLVSCLFGFAPFVTAQQDQTFPVSSFGLLDALSNGQTKVLFRYSGQYRNSNLHLLQDDSGSEISDVKIQQYSAIGGFIGYETARWHNFTAGATVYGAMPAGNNPDSRRGLGGLNEDDGSQDAYGVLGEMFIKYQNDGHLVKIGRQEMPDYRMVSLSNIRTTPITHSGAVYENRSFDGVSINLGYITKMKERNATEFIDMATGARLKESANGKQLIRGDFNPDDYDDTGYIGAEKEMTMVGLTYQHQNFSAEGWNYFVNDFVNSTYLVAQFDFSPIANDHHVTVAAQYTYQTDVGDHVGGNIDTWHYGFSVRGYQGALSWFANYNEVSYNENSYDGGTLFVRWGTPQMFNSFQVQDSELSGEKSVGVGLQYDFGRNGLLPGFVMRWRYGVYDLPDKLTLSDARQDRDEATFDLRYSFTKKTGFGIFTEMQGLSLQFRLAYNNYRTDYDFEAYRDLHGYDFQSATKDFYDARLYLDYHF